MEMLRELGEEVYRTDCYNKTYTQVAQEFAKSFPEPRKAKMTGYYTFKLVDGLAEYHIDSDKPKDSFPVYIIRRIIGGKNLISPNDEWKIKKAASL